MLKRTDTSRQGVETMKAIVETVPVVDRLTKATVGFHENATIVQQGREYAASGCHVDPECAAGYVSDDGRALTTWEGKFLAKLIRTARWPTPRSFLSNEMWQAEATIEGVRYTGRTGGPGLLWRGKRRRHKR